MNKLENILKKHMIPAAMKMDECSLEEATKHMERALKCSLPFFEAIYLAMEEYAQQSQSNPSKLVEELWNEVWINALDYEGMYQVSNLGNIKSLKYGKDRLLKPSIDKGGYYYINLCKDGKKKSVTLHRLIYQSFYGKTDLQVDHIVEGNKLDNRLSNLQAISSRENITKYRLSTNKSSKFTGVSWKKQSNKWSVTIKINGKHKHLGYYESEIEAANAYQQELLKLNQ